MSDYEPIALVDTKKIRVFYENYVNNSGITAGWPSMQLALESYAAASNRSNQRWTEFESILDVGSGEGHFLPFLKTERGFIGRYTALELLDLVHNRATELYGSQPNAHFINAEFLAYNFGEEQFDWVFSLGTLTIKQPQQREHDLAVCRKMIDLAKYGITVFVNNIDLVNPRRIEQMPELACYNIAEFVQMLQAEVPSAKVEAVRYSSEHPQCTMIHLSKQAE